MDGYAVIADISHDAQNTPTTITFDATTMPALGSSGAAGLQYCVYAADGTGVVDADARSLSGKLEGNTLTLDAGKNDQVLLGALSKGGKIHINNRFVLAACFYPRHSILDNGSPAYDQYKKADGSARYAQRPIQVAYLGNIRSAGGRRETGHLKVKTMVIENLADPASYPYVAGHYAHLVAAAMGPKQADKSFRLYYNENAGHYAGPPVDSGKMGMTSVGVGGILNQALLDLAAWAERGVTPLPSTRFKFDAMNQVILPEKASQRRGHQPVMHLLANGQSRVEVSVNQPVQLIGKIEMPPDAGRIFQYDWYLGNSDFGYEPATKLAKPQKRVDATRTISFPVPGEYTITLRSYGQRDGVSDVKGTTLLQNLVRVRVSVH